MKENKDVFRKAKAKRTYWQQICTTMLNKVLANAGAAGDSGLFPESGRYSGEEMVTHSSIFARIIPWTEEPGELQSMALQRVGHD